MVKHSKAEFLQEMIGVSRYTLERRLNRWPGSITHSEARNFKTGQPTGTVMTADTAVLWSSVGWFHTSRFNNK
jgi:hypothetical protein